MPIEVKIPAVGESITSGVVSVWHKKSGDFVNEGDALFTLETDKVSTEIVAEKAGVLETKADEGQEVKIGEIVATIDDSKQAATRRKEDGETCGEKEGTRGRETARRRKGKKGATRKGRTSFTRSSTHYRRRTSPAGENLPYRQRRAFDQRRRAGRGTGTRQDGRKG